MVRAILDGRKTQTRRVVKPQPENVREGWYADTYNHSSEWTFWGPRGTDKSGRCHLPLFRCPYGQPGDQLFVKETFLSRAAGRIVVYKADFDRIDAAGFGAMYGGWKPSIHMPRRASRLTLEITAIRVERLQEITDEDAIKEGVKAGEWVTRRGVMGPLECEISKAADTSREAFWCLWESINGADSWNANPFVWVVGFRRL